MVVEVVVEAVVVALEEAVEVETVEVVVVVLAEAVEVVTAEAEVVASVEAAEVVAVEVVNPTLTEDLETGPVL